MFSLDAAASDSLAAVSVELGTIATVVIDGTPLTGGSGYVAGILVGVLIQTCIAFDGTLSSWPTKIVIGILLFGFIALQRLLVSVTGRKTAAAR